MELNEESLFEGLLGLRRDYQNPSNVWENISIPMGIEEDEDSIGAGFYYLNNEYPFSNLSNSFQEHYPNPLFSYINPNSPSHQFFSPLGSLSPMDANFHTPIPQLDHSVFEPSCKIEPSPTSDQSPQTSALTIFDQNIARGKKSQGQPPSKNLMAERRRRKRLNDRLSMLRSVVPKISKMDRTSILGDTIDYMKELLERINSLQDGEVEDTKQLECKPSEILVRNSPKFEVERRDKETSIEICCAAKPGLLLSTVTTLEGLGLEIEQCVISCFNDFAMRATCSEELKQRTVISSEDIKQALFRNAGYGGRCL